MLVTDYSEAVLGTLTILLWKVGHCAEKSSSKRESRCLWSQLSTGPWEESSKNPVCDLFRGLTPVHLLIPHKMPWHVFLFWTLPVLNVAVPGGGGHWWWWQGSEWGCGGFLLGDPAIWPPPRGASRVIGELMWNGISALCQAGTTVHTRRRSALKP